MSTSLLHEGMTGLRPVSLPEKLTLAGVTAFSFVTSEEELLKDPDIRVYNTPEHALSSLRRSSPAPQGTSRVFDHADLESARYHLGRHLDPFFKAEWRYDSKMGISRHVDNLKGCVVIFPEPILVESSPALAQEILRSRKWVPCFNSDLVDKLIRSNPLFTRRKDSYLSFPVLAAKRLSKSGRVYRSPQAARDEARRQFMISCCAFHPEFTKHVFTEIHELFPQPFSFGTYPPSVILPRDGTWAEIAKFAIQQAWYLANLLQSILTFRKHPVTHPKFAGDIRSPIVYLQKHRKAEILSLLSLYAPYLHAMKSPIPENPRLQDHERIDLGQRLAALHSSLYALCRKLGLTSFPGTHPSWRIPVPGLAYRGAIYVQ